MSNSFDNKVKEALENFEMPYDAGAWADFEQQLPSNPPVGPTGGSSNGIWKIAAIIAVVGSVVTALWLSNSEQEQITQKESVVEVNEEKPIKAVVKSNPIPSTQEVQKPSQIQSDIEQVSILENQLVAEEPVADIVANENTTATKPENQQVPLEAEEETTESSFTENNISETPVIIDFNASALKACVGEEVNFINESSKNAGNLVWDFGDGSTSSETNPRHQYFTSGSYDVTLASESGIKKSITIKIDQTPSAVMNSERKLNGYQAIPLYVFGTATLPSETAVWNISDGSTLQGNNVTHLFRDAGNHTVELKVTNAAGCSSSLQTSIKTEKFNLLAPEAFTPNGDGINETFIPEALPEMGVDFEMSVQNPRTGEVVYRTGNPLEPWNGKLNNVNHKLENGVYVWTVVLKENIVENKIFNGKISLQP